MPNGPKQAMVKQALKKIVRATGIERKQVAAARMCCERHLLAAVGRSRKRWIGRILCYHSIGQEEWGINDVTDKQFRRHIELALKAGYRFVPASEIARTGGGPKDLAITFDDGMKSVATAAAPILKDYGLPWTFFPVSEWSDAKGPWSNDMVMDWRDIEKLLADGAEMGSHSATHPDFGKIGLAQMTDELGGSRDLFHKRLGFAPETFAIPLGQSMNWKKESMKAANDAGYSIVYAQAEETRPKDTIARTFVTKFDGDRIFKALLKGKFDYWEEWV
ncbi:MAG: polysaccharide deacetylase family protein [Hyphomonadaceae bacterium]